MGRVAVSNHPIPLTLTLSHGEREQSAAGSVVREVRRADTALGCAESQRRILPLPEGEGRGGRILEPPPDRGCVRRTSRSKCGCPKSPNDPKTRGLAVPLRLVLRTPRSV